MSTEHVAAMNEALAASAAVRTACAALPARRTLAYHLSGGPGGETVHWTMTFGDSVRFALTRPDDADVVFVGDWARMIRASRASRDGETLDPAVTVAGDPAILAEVGPTLELARSEATFPVEFPEV